MKTPPIHTRRLLRVLGMGGLYLGVWVAILVLRWRFVVAAFQDLSQPQNVVAAGFLVVFPIVVLGATIFAAYRVYHPRPREGMGTWALAWRTFRKKPRGVWGLTLLGFVYMVAFLCPVLSDYGPNDVPKRDTIVSAYKPPGTKVWVFAETRRGEYYGLAYRTVADELARTEADVAARTEQAAALEARLPPVDERTADQTQEFDRAWDQIVAREERVVALKRAEKRGGGLVLDREWDEYLDLWQIGKPLPFKRLGEPKRGWSRDEGGVRMMAFGGHEIPYRIEKHPLGTDGMGRDLLARIIYGSRISLTIGFAAMAVAVTLGTLFGVLAGFFGGAVDTLIMRFVDVLLAFPRLLLLLLIITIYQGAGIWVIVLVLGATGWMGVSRLVRAEVLRLKELDFVAAARVMGFSKARIMFKHLVPNAMAPVIVAATLMVGTTILVESALSFLGIGVEPGIPTWGNIVNAGSDALRDAWWIATIPGLAIVVTVVCFNLAGDALRDALDPRQRF
jgi:ABC-type dipeptide/oligopeptide/nickel transport system permease subunit